MKTIKERAKYAGIISQYKSDYRYDPKSVESGYMQGATEQKAIDEEEINKLYSIMESSASVLGIGTKWFNEEARQDAIVELKEMIRNYLAEF